MAYVALKLWYTVLRETSKANACKFSYVLDLENLLRNNISDKSE